MLRDSTFIRIMSLEELEETRMTKVLLSLSLNDTYDYEIYSGIHQRSSMMGKLFFVQAYNKIYAVSFARPFEQKTWRA